MPNDKQWQRRTDDWVKASHESRKRKEEARRRRGAEPTQRSGPAR